VTSVGEASVGGAKPAMEKMVVSRAAAKRPSTPRWWFADARAPPGPSPTG